MNWVRLGSICLTEFELTQSSAFDLVRLPNSIKLNPRFELDWVRMGSIFERSIDSDICHFSERTRTGWIGYHVRILISLIILIHGWTQTIYRVDYCWSSKALDSCLGWRPDSLRGRKWMINNKEGDRRRNPGSEANGNFTPGRRYPREELAGSRILKIAETWRKRKLQYCLILCNKKH